MRYIQAHMRINGYFQYYKPFIRYVNLIDGVWMSKRRMTVFVRCSTKQRDQHTLDIFSNKSNLFTAFSPKKSYSGGHTARNGFISWYCSDYPIIYSMESHNTNYQEVTPPPPPQLNGNVASFQLQIPADLVCRVTDLIWMLTNICMKTTWTCETLQCFVYVEYMFCCLEKFDNQ